MKQGLTLLFFLSLFFNIQAQEDCENRKNIIDDLTSAERTELAGLILDYVTSETNPNYNQSDPDPYNSFIEYKYTIIGEHTQFGDQQQTNINHSNEEFLSWHREYIGGLEAYLTDKGFPQYVPLPYWNPSQPMPSEFYNVMIQEYLDDGLNTAPIVATFDSNQSQTWSSSYKVDDDLCNEFTDPDEMGNMLVGDIMHASVHWEVGGAMKSQAATSGAAIFWPLHANIDRFYRCYQINCQCPQTDVSGFADHCDYCLKLDGSINADEFEFILIDNQGVELTIELNSDGCIPYQMMNAGEAYTVVVKGINNSMTDNIDCPDDEISHSFTAPYIQPTKWNSHPCLQVQTIPHIPSDYVMIMNQGDDTSLNMTNTNVNTGITTLIGQDVSIAGDETINVNVPFSSLITGVYYFSVEFNGEETGFEYFIP